MVITIDDFTEAERIDPVAVLKKKTEIISILSAIPSNTLSVQIDFCGSTLLLGIKTDKSIQIFETNNGFTITTITPDTDFIPVPLDTTVH